VEAPFTTLQFKKQYTSISGVASDVFPRSLVEICQKGLPQSVFGMYLDDDDITNHHRQRPAASSIGMRVLQEGLLSVECVLVTLAPSGLKEAFTKITEGTIYKINPRFFF